MADCRVCFRDEYYAALALDFHDDDALVVVVVEVDLRAWSTSVYR